MSNEMWSPGPENGMSESLGTIKVYHRAENKDQAVELKKAHPEAVYLAGGTQVNRAPLDRKIPEEVIDLRFALSLEIRSEGDGVIIGAMATLQDIADCDLLPQALRTAAGFIPTRNVRNQATVAGNIGAGRSDSYIIPALVALGAGCETSDGCVLVEDYMNQDKDDLIYSIYVPKLDGACRAVKESRSHLALPVVSAAVSVKSDRSEACVAVGCVAKKTIRLNSVEEGIVSGTLDSREKLEKAIADAISPNDDLLGSADYKKHVNGAVIADALMHILEELS